MEEEAAEGALQGLGVRTVDAGHIEAALLQQASLSGPDALWTRGKLLLGGVLG